MLHNYKSPSCD